MVVSDPAEGVLKWDATITYEFENDTVVDHTLDGTFSDRITCSGNWVVVDSLLSSTSDPDHLVKYRLDYDNGEIRELEQEDGDVVWQNYACDSSWQTETTTASFGWQETNTSLNGGHCSSPVETYEPWWIWPSTASEDNLTKDFSPLEICHTQFVSGTLESPGAPFTGQVMSWTENVPADDIDGEEKVMTGRNESQALSLVSQKYLAGIVWETEYDFNPTETPPERVELSQLTTNSLDWHAHVETEGFLIDQAQDDSDAIIHEGVGTTKSKIELE